MKRDKLSESGKLPRGKKPIIVALAVLVLVIAAGCAFFVVQKDSNEEEALCGDNTVQRYNKAAKNVDDYGKGIEEIAKEVEAKPDYEKSTTCVFIAYTHYAYAQNADKSRQLLELFKTLQASGQPLDSKIINPQTIDQMELYVKGLEHNRDIGDSADGSG